MAKITEQWDRTLTIAIFYFRHIESLIHLIHLFYSQLNSSPFVADFSSPLCNGPVNEQNKALSNSNKYTR